MSDPAVLEAAVIGVPDEKWGEVVDRLRRTASRRQYQPRRPAGAVCSRKLAGYKRPTKIVVVDAIPKNPVGKTDKAPLRAAHLKGTSV